MFDFPPDFLPFLIPSPPVLVSEVFLFPSFSIFHLPVLILSSYIPFLLRNASIVISVLPFILHSPTHSLVTANCATFLDWHCFPRGRRTAVMIGGSNVLTIFLEHKHCHSVWKATLIEHRFVQAAHWMDFPRAWLVLQLILAIDWTRIWLLPTAASTGCRAPLDLRAEDLACSSAETQAITNTNNWMLSAILSYQTGYVERKEEDFSWHRFYLRSISAGKFICHLPSSWGIWVMPVLGPGLLKGLAGKGGGILPAEALCPLQWSVHLCVGSLSLMPVCCAL